MRLCLLDKFCLLILSILLLLVRRFYRAQELSQAWLAGARAGNGLSNSKKKEMWR